MVIPLLHQYVIDLFIILRVLLVRYQFLLMISLIIIYCILFIEIMGFILGCYYADIFVRFFWLINDEQISRC